MTATASLTASLDFSDEDDFVAFSAMDLVVVFSSLGVGFVVVFSSLGFGTFFFGILKFCAIFELIDVTAFAVCL